MMFLKDKFYLHVDENQTAEETKNKDIFLIVRSLKYDDGTQKVRSHNFISVNLFLRDMVSS